MSSDKKETKKEEGDENEQQTLIKENKIYEYDAEKQYLSSKTDLKQDETQYNLFYEFIKQLSSGAEIYRISVPTFILQPISILEKISTYTCPNSITENLPKAKNVEERFLTVTAWAVSTWATIPRKGIHCCKPYNPVLGEQFFCSWKLGDGSECKYIGEQVTHHPPCSAFYMINEKHQYTFSGWVNPSLSFSVNSVSNVSKGEFRICLLKHKEQYHIDQPYVCVGGLIYGEQKIELYNKMKIQLNDNFKAELNFYTGKENALDGNIINKKGKEIYKIEGKIDDKVYLIDDKGEKKLWFDAMKVKLPKKIVAPLHKQKVNESRRNWHKVTKNLKKKDFATAQKEKHLIEEYQRALRKKRKEDGKKFQPKLFEFKSDNWHYKKSSNPKTNKKPEEEQTWGGYLSSFFY